MKLTDLRALTSDRSILALTSVSDLIPIGGEGTQFCPPTFAESKDNAFPEGIAMTENTPQLAYDSDAGTTRVITDERGIAVPGTSVIVDTVGSQATRAETALWNLRDELDLPGIVFRVPEKGRIRSAVDAKLKGDKTAAARITPSVAAEAIARVVAAETPNLSSWTTPHRHVDGLIRLGEQNGKTVWRDDNDLYRRIIASGPGNLGELLRLSPNSVLFGFWGSIGMPIRYRLARSFTQEVTGYGAQKIYLPATKSTPFEFNNDVLSNDKGEVKGVAKSTGPWKKPSELGLGSVPAGRANAATCTSIIGRGDVSLAHLRNVLRRDKGLTAEQQTAALDALVALAVLGRVLVLEDGFYRSGCTLVDRDTSWTAQARGRGAVKVDLPQDVDTALELAQEAFAHAAGVGAWGTAADREELDISDRVLGVTVTSYIEQMTKEKAED